MDDEIQRTALRATAKVALALTVIGCGSRVTVSLSDDGGTQDDAAGGAGGVYGLNLAGTGGGRWAGGGSHGIGGIGGIGGSGASAGAGGSEELLCGAPPPGESVTIDPAQFACCSDWLTDNHSEAWNNPSAEVLSCCNEIVGQSELDPTRAATVPAELVAQVWPSNDAPSCCDVLGNPCSAPCGCTVWGPPVPAPVAGRLSLLDELARQARVAA